MNTPSTGPDVYIVSYLDETNTLCTPRFALAPEARSHARYVREHLGCTVYIYRAVLWQVLGDSPLCGVVEPAR